MSTGYGWEGIRRVCATLLGARHVPERLCGGACLQRGAITSVRPFTFSNISQPQRKTLTTLIFRLLFYLNTVVVVVVLVVVVVDDDDDDDERLLVGYYLTLFATNSGVEQQRQNE